MDTSEMKLAFTRRLLALASVATLALAACAPQAAAPTVAPAKPAATTAPAKPAATAAPAKPAPTAAPAKPAATAAPAAKPAGFDEKAVADFYKGKTVRLVVGFGPGGATDTSARLLQQVLGKYLPGNPTVVVENKPGGGSMLAANTVYASEPKDGTAIAAFSSNLVLQQATSAAGVQYDAAKFQWLGSSQENLAACAARVDSGISSVQDIMEGGKEVTVASYGKGTASYNPPAAMNALLGTRFKIVTGYDGDPAVLLAMKNKEVQGLCTTFDLVDGLARDMFEGANPVARVLIVTGSATPNHPFLKGVPAAETLAKTDEARTLLKAVQVPFQILFPYAVAPEVPKDRVEALRKGFDKAYADAELVAAAKKAQFSLNPKTGEEVSRTVRTILDAPPAALTKLKTILD